MNILFVLPYVPSRIRIRPFNFIKELSERHSVYVVCQSDSSETGLDDEIMKYAKDICVIKQSKFKGYLQALLATLTPIPGGMAFCMSRKMKNAIGYTMENMIFDVIHLEHLRAVSFLPKSNQTPVLFDDVDCLTDLFMQMAKIKKNPFAKITNFIEAVKLRFYEPRTIKRFRKTIITSVREKRKLKSFNDKLVIDVIGNGVDSEYFKPAGRHKYPHRIVFNGKMSYAPNANAVIWFANNVFPLIKQRVPDAEFVIVGSKPSSAVKALAKTEGITVTGFVEDLRPYLDESSVAVVPMRIAVGVQNKLLEDLAMGLPVVTTSISSPGQNVPGVFVADSPEEMADTICELFEDDTLRKEEGAAAREFVKEKCSWSAMTTKLETIYGKLTGKDK